MSSSGCVCRGVNWNLGSPVTRCPPQVSESFDSGFLALNQVVLWDKIVLRGDNPKLLLKDMKTKYFFFDDGNGLKSDSFSLASAAGRRPVQAVLLSFPVFSRPRASDGGERPWQQGRPSPSEKPSELQVKNRGAHFLTWEGADVVLRQLKDPALPPHFRYIPAGADLLILGALHTIFLHLIRNGGIKDLPEAAALCITWRSSDLQKVSVDAAQSCCPTLIQSRPSCLDLEDIPGNQTLLRAALLPTAPVAARETDVPTGSSVGRALLVLFVLPGPLQKDM
ncbi:hypothetical protein CB1_000350076 [Camelus ferus]|nr:hypothetical protein CB1_000350076 [Camelus ferus]